MSTSTTTPRRRNTKQRDALQQVIAEANGPLSVQELVQAAGRLVEGVGIATVYRTLRLLEEEELIHPVGLPDGEIRWEASDRGHHHHFQCRSCSRVLDLAGCPLHLHAESIPTGFVVERHEITLVGLCSACTGKQGRRKPPRKG